MASFESLLIKTDVSALKIIKDDFLLAGFGGTLSLLKISSFQCISQHNIFVGARVHGITPSTDEHQILVHGGKQLKLLSVVYDCDANIKSENFHVHADDWILAVIWMQNHSKAALLTAHNVIQLWDIKTQTKEQSYNCEEKCIIYSGLLLCMGSNILAMAGTVFSQVVIWKNDSERVLNKLIGHKGVIFSIAYNDKKNIIVTTSDDRSVRVWDITEKCASEKKIEYWNDVSINMRVVMFGHTARVMRNIIINDNIASIGEDSAMCIWDFNGNLINKRKLHQDGCLWSIDYNESSNIIVTGGSDAGIMVHPLLNNFQPLHNSKTLPRFKWNPKKIAITFRGNIVCLTEHGNLFYYDVEMCEWSEKMLMDSKHSNMTISKCRQFIALSNMNGEVNIIAETCKFDPDLKHCISQKITENNSLLSLHWLADRNIIICEKQGHLSIWNSRDNRLIKRDEFLLPACKERWLTAACEINESKYGLIVGDRCGNMHLFDKETVQPIQTINKVHGRLGINYINFIKDYVVTTGRDGSVKYFKIIQENGLLEMRLLNCIKFSFNWLEKFIDKTDFICGYRESQFIIWNVKENLSIAEIDCGGGHRSWDIQKQWHKNNGELIQSLQFIYIKQLTVHSIDINVNYISRSIVKGTHIREINSLQAIPFHPDCSIITGGEDTTIRMHNFHFDESFHFEEKHIVNKHLSSIRCMCLKKVDDSNYILFSGGGRAQICAWMCTNKQKSIEYFEIGNFLLKGSDRERRGNSGWKQVEIDTDAETRIMSLYCLDCVEMKLSNSEYLLLAGCSDGYLRTFTVKICNQKCIINLKDSVLYEKRCILQVHCIKIESAIVILTMSTNGVVAFWNSPLELPQLVYQVKLHKSGINSFDVKKLNGNTILLATGGDDNDLQLNVLALEIRQSKCENISLISKCNFDSYHCAQITGIKLIDGGFVLSASIDQRITLLKWACDNNQLIQCVFVDQYHTNIPDVQGMKVLSVVGKEIHLCIYGKGIEFIKISL